MSTFRCYLALFLLVTVPPVILFWLLVHPFIRFWRKVGATGTYAIVLAVIAAAMIGLFLARRPLMSVEFGTRWPLVAAGAACLAASAALRVRLGRDFGLRVIVGLPEVAPERHSVGLVTQGIYARIRHPRYVQMLLGLLGYALIANYLSVYVVWTLWLPGAWVIVLLEERELRDRFGDAYVEYCRRVPRFFPRLR